MNFSNIKNLTIPEGSVTALSIGEIQMWAADTDPIVTITGEMNYVTIKNGDTDLGVGTHKLPAGTVLACTAKTKNCSGSNRIEAEININSVTVKRDDSNSVSYEYTVNNNITINCSWDSESYTDYMTTKIGYVGIIDIIEE
jgi:hypothetical protein